MSEVNGIMSAVPVLNELHRMLSVTRSPILVKMISPATVRIAIGGQPKLLASSLNDIGRMGRAHKLTAHRKHASRVFEVAELYSPITGLPLSNRDGSTSQWTAAMTTAIEFAAKGDPKGFVELERAEGSIKSLKFGFASTREYQRRGANLEGFGPNVFFDWLMINDRNDAALRQYPELHGSLRALQDLSLASPSAQLSLV